MNALGIVLILSAAGGQTAPTSANLVGATVQVNNAPAVRLRWMMEEGWIPAGGYNLYRSDGTNTIKLNSSPLKVKDTVGLSDKVFQTAIQPIRIGGPQSLISLAKPTRQSSATTFAAMRTSVASLKGLAGGPVTPTQIHAAITKTPAVAGFMSSLPKTPPGAAKQVLTANQKIAIARSHLAMTAMTMPGAADTLGMGFDDTKATLNANYTYTLKVINGAGETAVGTFAINVGHDPLPPAPVLEAPVQTGIGAMSLHLEVPQGVDESKFGILYYRVTRTDTAHPQGLLLSNGHIVPTYTRLPNGTEVASLVTYLDQVKNTGDRTTSVPAVAVGNVTYAAQLFDSFGRSNGAPVTTTGVCKDIAPPGAVNGATATYETGVGGKQFVVVNFAPSVGDATAPNPNPNDVSYLYQRRNTDDPNAPWVTITAQPIPLTMAQETELTVKQMSHLYPSFQAGATKAAQSAVAKAGGPKKASAAGKFFALSKMSVPAFRSANAAFLAPNLTFPVGKFADTSVEADHYYQYQVIPILKRNLVAGNGAKSTPVGVPAVAKVPAPAVTLTDAIAPKLLQFKAASTNVLKLQATHGIFEPNSLVASKDSVSHGAALSQNLVAARSKVLLSSPAGPRNLVAAGALHPVAANYGRMVTVSWAAPNYTSACSFKVYRANGTGYTSNVSAENIPTSLASASAEDQGTKAGGNRAVAPSLPQARKTVTTTIQNPKAVAAGLPKQKSALSGIGAFRNVNARILFSLDTSPPLAAYALLGQTAPGATQFIDLIPRSQSNTFYYYVVPVNRWGMTGTPSSPAKVKTLPSLPPSVPVLMAVSPTETQSLSATVQPNIVPEDVVEYRLYRMPFPVNALITAPNARAVLTGGRLTGNTNTKSSSIMVSKTFGNRVLVAKGAGLAGGAKFGILQTQSPAASLGQYQSLVKASLINKSTTPAMPLELQALFPLANYTQVGSTKANPTSTDPVAIADPGAAPGVEYVYRVVAVDSAGLTSEPSTVMDAMALKLWCDPPAQSGQASYSAAMNTVSFALAPPATGCAAFVIERAIDAGATKFVQVKILAANGATPVSFSDTAVRPGQTYTYHVSAIDAAGNSSKRTGTTDNAGGVLTIVVKT